VLRTPAAAIGGFYATSLDSVRFAFRRPFQTREFLRQAWFIAGVCLAPTLLMSIPFCVITVFQLNQLLIELGGADLSGAGAGLGVVYLIGRLVYFTSYVKDPNSRSLGYGLSVMPIMIMVAGAVIGAIRAAVLTL